MVSHWSVDSCTSQRNRLPVINGYAHIELRLSTVDRFMPRGCWHSVVVGIGSLLVPREWELSRWGCRSSGIKGPAMLRTNSQLIKRMLVVCLEKLRHTAPRDTQVSMAWSCHWPCLLKAFRSIVALVVLWGDSHCYRGGCLIPRSQLLWKAFLQHLSHRLVMLHERWLFLWRSCLGPSAYFNCADGFTPTP